MAEGHESKASEASDRKRRETEQDEAAARAARTRLVLDLRGHVRKRWETAPSRPGNIGTTSYRPGPTLILHVWNPGERIARIHRLLSSSAAWRRRSPARTAPKVPPTGRPRRRRLDTVEPLSAEFRR